MNNKELDYCFIVSDVNNIYNYAEKIAGEWNGDKSGSQEDRARCALDIMECCKNLKELLEELNN